MQVEQGRGGVPARAARASGFHRDGAASEISWGPGLKYRGDGESAKNRAIDLAETKRWHGTCLCGSQPAARCPARETTKRRRQQQQVNRTTTTTEEPGVRAPTSSGAALCMVAAWCARLAAYPEGLDAERQAPAGGAAVAHQRMLLAGRRWASTAALLPPSCVPSGWEDPPGASCVMDSVGGCPAPAPAPPACRLAQARTPRRAAPKRTPAGVRPAACSSFLRPAGQRAPRRSAASGLPPAMSGQLAAGAAGARGVNRPAGGGAAPRHVPHGVPAGRCCQLRVGPAARPACAVHQAPPSELRRGGH
jgi:hypothetical protein